MNIDPIFIDEHRSLIRLLSNCSQFLLNHVQFHLDRTGGAGYVTITFTNYTCTLRTDHLQLIGLIFRFRFRRQTVDRLDLMLFVRDPFVDVVEIEYFTLQITFDAWLNDRMLTRRRSVVVCADETEHHKCNADYEQEQE